MVEPFVSQPASCGTCYCVAIRQCLKSTDMFRCGNCGEAWGNAPTDSESNLLLPVKSDDGGDAQTQGCPTMRGLFAQVTGKAPGSWLAGNQVSFASARDEVMATFSSHRKVAEYQKLGRGHSPAPLAAANAARKVGRHNLLLNVVTLTQRIFCY